MSSVPRTPSRGNWIWLASGVLAVTVLTGAAFRYGGARCPVTGGSLAAGAAGRVASVAGANGARPAESTAGAGPASLARDGTRTAGGPGPGGGQDRARAAVAVYYDPGNAVGSCSLGPFPDGGHYVSLPRRAYAQGAACGTYLIVRGPRGQVRAKVVDLCPGCAPGMINLSRAAFARVANPGPGSARVRYWPAGDPPTGSHTLSAGAALQGEQGPAPSPTGGRSPATGRPPAARQPPAAASC